MGVLDYFLTYINFHNILIDMCNNYLNDEYYKKGYLFRGDFMAKPIKPTPVFEGEDALAVLKEMQEAPTKEDKEFAKEIRNQRIVLFSK